MSAYLERANEGISRVAEIVSGLSCPYARGAGTCVTGCRTEPSCITDDPGGTPDEIADDLYAVVMFLMEGHRVPALASLVRDRLQRWESEQDEARATMLADVDPEEVY